MLVRGVSAVCHPAGWDAELYREMEKARAGRSELPGGPSESCLLSFSQNLCRLSSDLSTRATKHAGCPPSTPKKQGLEIFFRLIAKKVWTNQNQRRIHCASLTRNPKPTETMTTYATTTKSIFTPEYDRTLNLPFTGNHLGYAVTFFRDGDSLTVNHYGEKGMNPVRPLLATETHSISSVVSGLVAMASEMGIEYQVEDNIPQGFSLAH